VYQNNEPNFQQSTITYVNHPIQVTETKYSKINHSQNVPKYNIVLEDIDTHNEKAFIRDTDLQILPG